jgi:hypothetical protein
MTTIEPEIQEKILDILPNDYNTSIDLICQLLANMMLCANGSTWVEIENKIKLNLAEYEGT